MTEENTHIDKVVEEFTRQAKTFNDYQKDFSKAEFTDWAVEKIGFAGNENVLEVAAGTCAFGRSVALCVSKVTELDATKAMLEVGKKKAQELSIKNQVFVEGVAENLPFKDEEFDCVISRLAFHHFVDIAKPFEEMMRVVKTNGKIVIIDMEAREEWLRDSADYYEALRDPSHTRCVSHKEFIELAKENDAKVEFCETIAMPVSLKAWMGLTNVSDETREKITQAMKADINGGEKTGFEPYLEDEQIYFNHRWMLFICTKGD